MRAWFGKECTEIFLELQPLARKDAQTLTHALVQAVGYAANAAVSQRPEQAPPLRLVHLLTGDGIATNMAAARRLFRHFQQKAAFQYRLLVWSCASRRLELYPDDKARNRPPFLMVASAEPQGSEPPPPKKNM